MKYKLKLGKAVMILICVTAFVTLFTFIVMSLWNGILPDVLGVKAITFKQALGILVLSKILFSGFGGFSRKREQFKNRFRQRMMEKWEKMSPDEKQRFKEEWKNKCGGAWGRRFGERNFADNFPDESK